MGVVLLILKILGITILCILGLVLLILALVLFVPIRYRAEGSIESKDNHRGTVRVHWLLHAIDVRVIDDPVTKTISKRIRILGLFGKKMDSVIFPKTDGEESDGEYDEPESTDAEQTVTSVSADGKKEENVSATVKPEGKKDETPAEEPAAEESKPDGKKEDKKPEGDKPEGDRPEDDKPEAEAAEGSDTVDNETAEKPKKRSIGERIEDLKETASCVLELFSRRKDLLKEYLTKKSTKAAIGKLWKTALWLLKTIAPRKGHAEVTFGLKDPEMTGKAFAAAAALYPWYGRHVDLYPDFTQEIINGEGDVRGRLRLWGVAIRALSILFDKNIKKVRREFGKVKDKMTSTPAEIKKIIKKEDAA